MFAIATARAQEDALPTTRPVEIDDGLFLVRPGGMAVVRRGTGPTTQTVAVPPGGTNVESADLSRWFAELGSPSSDIREQARTNLMGLTRADLPALREVVAAARPLAPAQAAVLHAIVTQIYLAEEPYEPAEVNAPFLGLRLPVPQALDLESADDAQLGVPVVERFPGFPAYRYLRDGDVLLSIGEAASPNADEGSPQRFEMHLSHDVSDAVGRFRVGQTVRVEVLRLGRSITVDIPLTARKPDVQSSDQLLGEREHAAEDFWEKNFAALVVPDAS